jgi:hypothetical protein
MSSVESTGKHRRFIRILWLLVGLVSLSAVITSVYTLVLGSQVEDAVSIDTAIVGPVLVTAWAVVGGLILARYPRHTIGWLLLAMSGLQMLQLATFILPPPLVELGRLHPDAFIVRLFNWFGLWAWMVYAVLPALFLPLFFPSGTLLSRRWRIVAAAGVLGTMASVLSLALGPGEEGVYANPFVIPGGEVIANVLFAIGAPTLIPAILASVLSMVLRYRRAAAVERQQMKWLFVPLSVFILWLIYDMVAPTIWPEAISQTVTTLAFTTIGAIIPAAIGIAILRYRLYDIDLIIRRTLVYGVVTAGLAIVYFGSVVLLQQLFAGVSGEQSPAAIVMSTLLIAALFSPLRRRAQAFIDRRFYRAKYDMAQTLAGFVQTARNETDLEALTAELQSVVRAAMQPERVGVWLRPRPEESNGLGVTELRSRQ